MQPRKRPKFTPINWESQSSGFRPLPQEALQPAPPRTQMLALNNSTLAPKVSNGINLLSPASALPDRLRSLFPFAYFNAMQSEAFPSIYETDTNIVLSAPTASGKTTCFDFAIARLMRTEGTTGTFKVCIINLLC
jgi:ATP-dependent DNA helicase HFM1/MER3